MGSFAFEKDMEPIGCPFVALQRLALRTHPGAGQLPVPEPSG